MSVSAVPSIPGGNLYERPEAQNPDGWCPAEFSTTIRGMLSHADLVEHATDVPNPSQAVHLLATGEANSVFLVPTAFDWPATKELLQLCTMTFPVCLVALPLGY